MSNSVTPWTSAYQAPPSMRFSRQEYWSGVPLSSRSTRYWASAILGIFPPGDEIHTMKVTREETTEALIDIGEAAAGS